MFTKEDLLALLDEAFVAEQYESTWFKDNEPASSIMPMLNGMNAQQALELRCGRNPVAGHAQHLAFTLEGVARALRGEPWDVDWECSWKLPENFDDQTWSDLRERLRAAYDDVVLAIQEREDWSLLELRRGTLGQVAHSAYHLGAMRQLAITS